MFAVKAKTLSAAWEKSLQLFLEGDRELLDGGAHGGPFLERLNTVIQVTHPSLEVFTSPSFSYPETLFGINEMQKDSGFDEAIVLGERMRRWKAGRRSTVDQLRHAIDVLRHHPGSRQAVITLWDPSSEWDDPTPLCPCMIQLRATITPKKQALNITVISRSCDAWLGAPVDLAAFSSVQQYVAGELGLAVGNLVYHVVSYHIYQQDLEAVRQALIE